MSSAAAVTDASFEQDVLKSDVPVLVDFWAPWCGPCRMVAPIVDEIAKEYEGKIRVYKLNTDENPNVASQYGIRSIPTLMLFKGGQKVDTVVGAVPKNTLSGTISKYLLHRSADAAPFLEPSAGGWQKSPSGPRRRAPWAPPAPPDRAGCGVPPPGGAPGKGGTGMASDRWLPG